MLRPSPAAMLGIMAGAAPESNSKVPALFSEGRAAGRQPGSAAGARGGGTAETRGRPNVEVNRRAEGTSELNRRLGAVGKGAEALERCGYAGDCSGAAGDYGWGLAGKQAENAARAVPGWESGKPAMGAECPNLTQMVRQHASNRVAPPESEGVESGSQAKA